jgi:N-methylhydantoinase A/oxoprolinase/acetone carboxylase beta subunit
MNDSNANYLGLDAGDTLTLAALWAEPAGAGPGPREASWPVRARIQALRATAAREAEEIRGLIRELCAQCGCRPEECTLVRMGQTWTEFAAETAASLNMRGIVEPSRRFVLWSEGVLPASEVKEYARTLPAADAIDLDELRAGFAELMEQATADVQAKALDQDDTVLDRFIDARCRGTAEVRTVAVESLTDIARLLGPFYAACGGLFTTEVEIVTARLRCLFLT